MKKTSIFRIVDVNINRASEGMRVLEEISRFILNDKKLTLVFRDLRSELIKSINYNSVYLDNRNIKNDFGKDFMPKERENIYSIVKANAKRVEEALRVLEEFSVKKELFFKMRFKVYDLEKSIISKLNKRGFYKTSSIDLTVYVVHDDVDILIRSIKSGAKIIQLRDKTSSAKIILKKAKEIMKFIDRLLPKRKPIFIINDRVDIAVLSKADGVHLGQDDLSVSEAKNLLGFGKIIGKSTHDIEQGLKAQKEGAVYVSVGPVYSTPTKPKRHPVGLEYVKQAAEKIRIPWVAIGGINRETAEEVVKAGARNLAVVRAFKDVQYLKRLINKHYESSKL